MRQGQSKRMRGRSRGGGGGSSSGGSGGGKGPNPLTRNYESNGPDVKIRGNAGTIADKYVQLSRDALSAGDPVAAENYLQHAEHYYRLLAAAQAQYQPHQTFVRADADDFVDADFDAEGDETIPQPSSNGAPQAPAGGYQQNNGYQGRQQNSRSNGAYGDQPRNDRRDRQDRQEPRRDERQPRTDGARAERAEPQPQPRIDPAGEQPSVGELPAFITGGGASRSVEAVEPESARAPEPAAPVEAPEAVAAAPQDGDERDAGATRGRRRRYGRSRAPAAEGSDAPADAAPAEPAGD